MSSIFKKIRNSFTKNLRRFISKNKGSNNDIKIGKSVNVKYSIKGNNNKIDITQAENFSSAICKVDIKILGNNNSIIIKNADQICKLKIFIGNYNEINNCNIFIDEHITITDLTVLGYSNNSKLNIGKKCLFSKNVQIRMGELPHLVIDKLTGKVLDKGADISIGEHCWIGENSVILKNASIESDNIVGLNSVVTKKFLQKNTVIAGNPAQVRKENVDWREK